MAASPGKTEIVPPVPALYKAVMKKPQHPSSKKTYHRRKPRKTDDDAGPVLLYGLHTVAAALANPRRQSHRLIATPNAVARLRERDAPLNCEIIEKSVKEISRLVAADAVHQGVVLEANPLPPLGLDEIAGWDFLLALDQTTDPHNVGAILRSAAAFAVDAVIVPRRHSAAETAALAKAASGALDIVPLASVRNLSDTLAELGKAGMLRVGLDSAGDAPMEELVRPGPMVVVLGSEGKGLRPRTRENCDHLARLDMPGAIKSLTCQMPPRMALYIATRRSL